MGVTAFITSPSPFHRVRHVSLSYVNICSLLFKQRIAQFRIWVGPRHILRSCTLSLVLENAAAHWAQFDPGAHATAGQVAGGAGQSHPVRHRQPNWTADWARHAARARTPPLVQLVSHLSDLRLAGVPPGRPGVGRTESKLVGTF